MLRQLRHHREGKGRSLFSLHFFLDVGDEVDCGTLPEGFWLGFDELGFGSPIRVVTTTLARVAPGPRPARERHRGLQRRPRLISLLLGSEQGTMFRRLT